MMNKILFGILLMGSVASFAQKSTSVQIRFINDPEPLNQSTHIRYSSHFMDPVYGLFTHEVSADSSGTYIFDIPKGEKFAYLEMTTGLKFSAANGKYLLYRQIVTPGDNVKIVVKDKELRFSGKGHEKYEAHYRLAGLNGAWLKYLGDSLNRLAPEAYVPDWRKDTLGYLMIPRLWERMLKTKDNKFSFYMNVLNEYRTHLDPVHYELMRIELLASSASEVLQTANSYLKFPPPAATEKMKLQTETFLHRELINYWNTIVSSTDPERRKYCIGFDQLLISALENRTIFGEKDDFWALAPVSQTQRDRALVQYFVRNCLRKKDNLLTLSLLEKMVETAFAKKIVNQLKTRRDNPTAIYGLSLMDTAGKRIQLSQFKGKTVVLDFWFTGCAGCALLAPHLEKIMDSVRDRKDLVFLSISIDNSMNKWKNSVKQGAYSGPGAVQFFTEGLGHYHPVVKYFNVMSYPRLIIIGKDGNLISETPPRPHDEASRHQFISLLK